MAFHDIRFPDDISLGAMGGPKRRVSIVELANGREIRQSHLKASRRSYVVGSGIKELKKLYDIISFFEAREGRLHGFRFKDWSDYKSCAPTKAVSTQDQVIGYGDDIQCEFQLQKNYQSGVNEVYRTIIKPVMGTVQIGIASRICDESEYSVDFDLGLIIFREPPQSQAPIYAGFEFDVPVRFDCESLDLNISNFQAGEIPNIPLVEIIGEFHG